MKKTDNVQEGLKWIQKCDVINIIAEMLQTAEVLETQTENWNEKENMKNDIETIRCVVNKVDKLNGKTPLLESCCSDILYKEFSFEYPEKYQE